MSRKKNNKFDYADGVYYFSIKKGFNNNIIINRRDKDKAIMTFANYQKIYPDKCEWLGKWEGKSFVEDNFDKLESSIA